MELLSRFNIDLIQCIVLVLGITEVFLARANSIWLYPTGIAATALSIYSLFGVQLYAECILNLYYLLMSLYGWWYWLTKNDDKPVVVSFANKSDWLITISIVIGGWLLLYFFLIEFTDSSVPVWDAWVSATGWAGMWLLARRKVENWLWLNVSNAFAIPLLYYKELPLFAVLTAFLFIVACFGYVDWSRIARRELLSTSKLSES